MKYHLLAVICYLLFVVGCGAPPPRELPKSEKDGIEKLLLVIDEVFPGTQGITTKSNLTYYHSESEFSGGQDFARLVYQVPKSAPLIVPKENAWMSMEIGKHDVAVIESKLRMDKAEVGTVGTRNISQKDHGKYFITLEEWIMSETRFLVIEVIYRTH